MGGQSDAHGQILRGSTVRVAPKKFFRSALASSATHIIDADQVGYGLTNTSSRLAAFSQFLKQFEKAGLREQTVLVAGGLRPSFKCHRGSKTVGGSCGGGAWGTLHSALKKLEASGWQVCRAESECDWSASAFVEHVRAQHGEAIVWSTDLDFVNHLCRYTAKLVRTGDFVSVQLVDLQQAVHNLGLQQLGVEAFALLAVLLTGGDFGSALQGLGPVNALKCVRLLQRLACSPTPGTEPLALTPENIYAAALECGGQRHDSQLTTAGAVRTLAFNLNIFRMIPQHKVFLDFESDTVTVGLGWVREPRGRWIDQTDSISVRTRQQLEELQTDLFAGMKATLYDAYQKGEVDLTGNVVSDCGQPTGLGSLLDVALEVKERGRNGCTICGRKESKKFLPDFYDWMLDICQPCYLSIRYRTNSCTSITDAIASLERDLRCDSKQAWIGEPCCICERVMPTGYARLPAEIEDYCDEAGLVDLLFACSACRNDVCVWAERATYCAKWMNQNEPDEVPIDPDQVGIEFAYWRVVMLRRYFSEVRAGGEAAARRGRQRKQP